MADIRQITHLDRNQVVRLMRELREENPSISAPGRGALGRAMYSNMRAMSQRIETRIRFALMRVQCARAM